MILLPASLEENVYWKDIYHQPLPFWQPALDEIAARHKLDSGGWQRARLGRNVVFYNQQVVVKLGPPFWPGNMQRESLALAWVSGRLPARTPDVLAVGELSGWDYLLQRRLDGRNLWELWKELNPAQRADLAIQHGELLAALQGLPADGLDAGPLRFDWEDMLGWQRGDCARSMLAAGFDPALVEQVEPYLVQANAGLEQAGPVVLLHGDLCYLNFLVHPRGDGWRIDALIDWGDVKVGPVGHEFISPAVNMYKGDRASIDAFYRGCGAYAYPLRARHEVMARAMLYYSGELFDLFKGISAAAGCRDWDCLAGVVF